MSVGIQWGLPCTRDSGASAVEQKSWLVIAQGFAAATNRRRHAITGASCGGRDGGAADVPKEALLRHKEQQGPEGQNTRCSTTLSRSELCCPRSCLVPHGCCERTTPAYALRAAVAQVAASFSSTRRRGLQRQSAAPLASSYRGCARSSESLRRQRPAIPLPSPLPSPALPSPHPVALSRIAPALQASGAVRGSVRECSGGNVHVCMQISARRPNTLPNIAKRHKNVSRIYGGHLSHGIVKERYVDIPASTVDAADCQQRRACVPNTGCFHPAQPDQFYMMICRAEQDHPSLPHRGAEDREARSQSSDEEGSRVNASVGAMPRWSMARCRLGLQRCCVPQQSIAALWSPNAA